MSGILAIDTSTDACSVAVLRDGQIHSRHEFSPRRHNSLLFSMLRELLPNGDLRAQGIAAIAFSAGPGSFTGLRIAASAVQGLAYANELPALAVSTLACQVHTALRRGDIDLQSRVLSAVDARINEVYCAYFDFADGLASQRTAAIAVAPAAIPECQAQGSLDGVGSGCRFQADFPHAVRRRLRCVYPDILPSAVDLLPLAEQLLRRGEVLTAQQVRPVYVRDEITWKKLAQQGKAS